MGFLIFHFSRKTKTPQGKNIAVSETNSAGGALTNLDETNQFPPSPAMTNTDAIAQDILTRYRQGIISKEQAIQETLLEENQKSLDIYGKVVDQYGQPVSGAKIEGAVELNVSFIKNKVELHVAQTDSEGRFSFLGLHGTGLGIWPKKEGFFYNLKQPSKRPDDYKPNPNNPVVFTMWKFRGAEPLVGSSIDTKIPHDGSPVTFEVKTGKISSDGDLRVTLSQFPLEIRTGREKFDWMVKVEILNGGLIEESDPYPYWAPTNGYQSSFEFNMTSNAVKWLPNLKRNFYIRDAQGQYGVMQFSIYPGRSPTGIEANFTLNPSGSQNLEPALQQP